MSDVVIAKDKYGNKILLCENYPSGAGFDLHTDGRVYLSPKLAMELAKKLTKLARTLKP